MNSTDCQNRRGRSITFDSVRMRVGDGRNWLLLSGRKYDVITVDPAPPIWSAGTVNLYSREFMALARDALTEDGVAQFWVSRVVTKQELRMLLATFRFETGMLVLTEAGSTRRASIQLVRGEAGLRTLDPGGVEPLDPSPEAFGEALTRENHTLKRALTDPHLISGIGNAYSDEILHAARLSPLKLTQALTEPELVRLHKAVRETLSLWTDRLRRDAAGRFPEKVTAFREGMAVHGRFKLPCPVCGSPVQRIVYAQNECNYCATCQAEGRLLADRSLSRLLGRDWPARLE